ncbi:MAG: hypothetical protein U0169_20375 [Polyangiaceae bacterium]
MRTKSSIESVTSLRSFVAPSSRSSAIPARLALGTFLATACFAGANALGGCGSSGSDGTADSGASAPTNEVGKPPAKPSAAKTTATVQKTFAFRQLFLGDTDRTLAPVENGWRKLGYNLDGKVTTKGATDVCKPVTGGSVTADGENGIDNAFGEKIVPSLGIVPGFGQPSRTISQSLNDGAFTIMLSIVGLDDSPTQTNTGLTGQLFAGGQFDPAATDKKPTWSGSDVWPVRGELLVDGKTIAGGSRVVFNDSYVSNGTWVNGTSGDVTLTLAINGVPLVINVRNAVITGAHTQPGKLENGIVAGVVRATELIDAIKNVVGRFTTAACPGSALFNTLAQSIQQAADMRADGTTDGECDSLSVALGFTAELVANPTVVGPAQEPTPDACSADGGTDAATGDASVTDSAVTDSGSTDARPDAVGNDGESDAAAVGDASDGGTG